MSFSTFSLIILATAKRKELDRHAAFTQAQSEDSLFGIIDSNLDSFHGPIHLLGIGGIGMSALARLLLGQGIAVSGSDKSESEITRDLTRLGATVFIGHNASNIESAAAVAISTAIDPKNPELSWARQHNIPIWHRSQLLEALAKRKQVVAISGTHGKTTTTGMVAQVLIDCKTDPTVVIGGIFSKIGANAKIGKGEYFVAESDESDGTHAHLKSAIALVTNVEGDHLENYPGGLPQIYESMIGFANNASKFALLNGDNSGCLAIQPRIKTKVMLYGKEGGERHLDYSYRSGSGTKFIALKGGLELGEVVLAVPGEHNKENAIAAIAIALELGLKFEQVAQSLSSFYGVNRRFQVIGEVGGIRVVDDYAHHPTEVAATLKAARQYLTSLDSFSTGDKRVVAVFQPHQPGRLRDFWDEFCQAFGDADLLFVGDVYVARGAQLPGINSEKFSTSVQHNSVHYLPGPVDGLAQQIVPLLRSGDLVLTLGAGDITNLGKQLVEKLSNN